MSLALPAITFPDDLPVSAAREEIARAVAEHQVVVIAGATGSGKTTQLPKILLELGRERIGHTQPRRIAARSVAERIAEELAVPLGSLVGYQVRFDDRSSQETAVKVMTDGVLLAELSRDRMLQRYDTIIIDEAHERSLTIDFLLGYLARLLPQRPDLKLIITSATIDPERFAKHFAAADGTPAPIIEVSGRTFPVEIRYRPLEAQAAVGDDDDEDARPPKEPIEGILDALAELAREEPGDVLVFLSGENEIRDAADVIRGRYDASTEVLPLYGRLSAADQHRVFGAKPQGVRRRIVLATNVAETSLTVPGIRYVIDTGLARISRYSPRAKVQRLPIEPISQASANQRSGRAGRTSPGIAIRLYSEADFEKRPEFTDPEILRTNLAQVILQMLVLRLGDIAAFPFIQPPSSRGIKDGMDLLIELGAVAVDPVSGAQRLTKVGRTIAQLPVDVRFGRMLVEAGRNDVVREVAVIVAGLTIQDPRERPLDKREQANQLHARFTDPKSDFLSLLNLWNYLEEQQQALSGNAFRKLLKSEFLNYLRIREWQDLVRQILRQAKPVGLVAKDPRVDPDGIHKALLSGLLSRIGIRDDRDAPKAAKQGGKRGPAAPKREVATYRAPRGQKFTIFPGSGLGKRAPEAVMAAEVVETSRVYARTVAAIDPAWAEALAGDLVVRQYSEPRWSERMGSAVADEKVLLFGLLIVPKRRIQLARINPELARTLLIRHALVGGEWPRDVSKDKLYDFLRQNQQVRRELEAVEERTRRRDILVDDEAVVAFYEGRIPAEVTDVRAFEVWWREARKAQPDVLTMRREDLLASEERPDQDDYPAWIWQGEQRLRLAYRFEPGSLDDGVTVEIPLPLLPRIEDRGFDWLVPGLREDLVTALLKALPKAIRRSVVPAGDWARKLIDVLPVRADSAITAELARAIRTAAGVVADPSDFDWERVPAHLRMTFAAVDARGRRLGTSKDLAELQQRFSEQARVAVAKHVAAQASATKPLPGQRASAASADASAGAVETVWAGEREAVTSWDFGALPTHVDRKHGKSMVRGFPALVERGRGSQVTVALAILATSDEADREHARGVRRLLAMGLPSPLSYVQERLTQTEKLQLAVSPYQNVNALLEDVQLAVIDALAGEAAPRDEAAFTDLRNQVNARLLDELFAAVALTAKVLGLYREVDRAIGSAASIALMAPLADARAQLAALIHPGFVRVSGLTQLRRYPVYLQALLHRIEKMAEAPGRDRTWQNESDQALELYAAAGGTLPLTRNTSPALASVRWMLEELRVSLFAQHLGAQGPISVQRIRKAVSS